jgi:hypothetical protein
MSQPVLVAGAAGGTQGSTGRFVACLLMKLGIPVRALVHKLDARSDDLHKQGAEVIEGDLLNPASVQVAMKNIKRAYFTYPVAGGLLEATAIFASAARDAKLEMVVNNSQFRARLAVLTFAIYNKPPLFGICTTGLQIAFSIGPSRSPSSSSAALLRKCARSG